MAPSRCHMHAAPDFLLPQGRASCRPQLHAARADHGGHRMFSHRHALSGYSALHLPFRYPLQAYFRYLAPPFSALRNLFLQVPPHRPHTSPGIPAATQAATAVPSKNDTAPAQLPSPAGHPFLEKTAPETHEIPDFPLLSHTFHQGLLSARPGAAAAFPPHPPPGSPDPDR